MSLGGKMKKIIGIVSVIVSVFLMTTLLVACAKPQDGAKNKLKIVTTVYPLYDFTMEVLGDKKKDAEVSYLLESGVDLHSYQPKPQDVLKISEADVFIYVGGESEAWAENALKEAKNKNMITVNLMEKLKDKVKEEEIRPGMQEEKEHNEKVDGKEEVEETEYDEHIWLSIRNAKDIVVAINEAIDEADPKNKATYDENTEAYLKKLNELNLKYENMTQSAKEKTLVFADRFPFRYLLDDYGLNYYAAFPGCSAETEASFETVSFLAREVDYFNLHSVITIDGSDKKLAKTVIENTKNKNQKILTLNSLQSAKKSDIGKVSYLSVMNENYNVLKEALN